MEEVSEFFMDDREKSFWDLIIIVVFLTSIFYVNGMNQELHENGCKGYWQEYKGLNTSKPSVELKSNFSLGTGENSFETVEGNVSVNLTGLESESK